MKKCPLTALFNQVSKMWVIHIIHQIYIGNTTFNVIKKNLDGISSKILSERLKNLEEDEFIIKNISSETPKKIKYSLTAKGESFSEQTSRLYKWSEEWGY